MHKKTTVKISHETIDSIREKHPNTSFVFAHGHRRTKTRGLIVPRYKTKNNRIQNIGRSMNGWMISPEEKGKKQEV